MSTSLNVVSNAAVCCASTRRRAIVARRFDMRSLDSLRSVVVTAGNDWLRLVTTGSAGRGAGAAAVRSTSAFVTRGPEDFTDASGTSDSRAAFRADGVEGTLDGLAAGSF